MAAHEATVAALPGDSPTSEAPAAARRGFPRRLHWSTWLGLAFVVLGVLLRARQFAARRSLWLDEGLIADNVLRRNLHQLTKPLDHHQGAPFGWLVSEKISVHLLGKNEYGLRLTAFVASVLTLVLMWWVGARILPRVLVPVAVLAAAIAPQLIRYSNEVKQYSSDSFAVMLVVALSIWLVGRKSIGWWQALAWAIGGSFAVFLSHPGILATASCGFVVIASLAARRAWRDVAWITGGSCLIAVALLVHYELTLRYLSKDVLLKLYWSDGNPPQPLQPGSTVRWLGRTMLAFTHDPLKLAPPLLVGLLVVAGLIALVRRGWQIAALLAAPLIAQLIASTANVFPLSGRLVLGYVPLVLLLIAAAPTLLPGNVWLGAGLTAAVLAMLAPNAALAVQRTVHPQHFEELRPVLQHVASERQPGDLVFIAPFADTADDVYRLMGIDVPMDGSMFSGPAPVCTDEQQLRQAQALGRRVWFVSGHQQASTSHDSQRVREHLARLGRTLDDIRRPGAEAMLVQLSPSVPSQQPKIAGSCLNVVRAH